jgi:hypothetical protein
MEIFWAYLPEVLVPGTCFRQAWFEKNRNLPEIKEQKTGEQISILSLVEDYYFSSFFKDLVVQKTNSKKITADSIKEIYDNRPDNMIYGFPWCFIE